MRPAWRLVLTHVTYHGSSFVVKQRNATQRMRLHRTTTSHHPCTGAAGRQMQWSFFSPTTGEAYTPPIRTRLATSSRSDRPAPAAETCRACAVLGIMSRHVTPRCATPGLFHPSPASQPAVAKHIRVLHLEKSIMCCLLCDATARRRL